MVWSLGSQDGNTLDRDRALAAVAQATAAVAVPVTADLEGGYGAGPAEVGATVTRALASGVAGINREDGTRPRPTSPAASLPPATPPTSSSTPASTPTS